MAQNSSHESVGWKHFVPFRLCPNSCVKRRAERKPEVFRVRNLSLRAASLVQVCPLLEGEGLARASGHRSVKCLYLQIRQGKAPVLLAQATGQLCR